MPDYEIIVVGEADPVVEIIQELRVVEKELVEASKEFSGSESLTLTLDHTYKPGSIRLYKNGIRLNDVSFTESGATTIFLNVSRMADDEFIVDYKYLPE